MHVFSTDRVRARQEYKCIFCGRGIEPGEIHVASVVSDSGTIQVPRMCLLCDKMITEHELFEHGEELDPDIYEERVHDLCLDRNIPYKGTRTHELVDKILEDKK